MRRRALLLLGALLLELASRAPAATAAAANTTEAWLRQRRRAIGAVFGEAAGGVLPRRDSPDGFEMGVAPGVDAIRWDLPVGAEGESNISSTVFWAKIGCGGKGGDNGQSKDAFLFHHGHGDCTCPDGPEPADSFRCRPGCESPHPEGSWWDLYNVTSFLHALGHDAFLVSMPLKGVNIGPGSNATHAERSHWWFLGLEREGIPALRYFIEPAVLTINFAKAMGYDRIFFGGLSGGGWTTTVVSALDPRVELSFPVAGSLPCAMRDPEKKTWPVGNDHEDFEQSCAGNPNPENPLHPGRALYRVANYTAMYLLAGLEPGRAQLQVLHENDECCFAPVGRHDRVLAYERDVRAELGGGGRRQHGWFSVAVTNHTKHEVSAKEKAVIAAAMAGDFGPGDPGWERLPCDVLRGGGGGEPCEPLA